MNVRKATRLEKWISENLDQDQIRLLIEAYSGGGESNNHNYVTGDFYSYNDIKTARQILESTLNDNNQHTNNETNSHGKSKDMTTCKREITMHNFSQLRVHKF